VPTLRVPRGLVPLVQVLAASSLFIYVLHWQVLQAMRSTPWLGYAAGLGAGVAYWWVWTRGPGLVRSARSRLRPREETIRESTPQPMSSAASSH